MSGLALWMHRLEQELSRELGQPLTLAAGTEIPEVGAALFNRIVAPGASLHFTADAAGIAALLTEARVIEAGQADAETVRELWTGILASAAAGLGGQASPAAGTAERGALWVLRLGQARVDIRVTGEITEANATQSPAEPQRAASASGPAAFTGAAPAQPGMGNFDLLLEVELDAAVRFGSREMELKDLLELGPGDVVELDRQVADPVDLVVGDRIVARGEVVLVNGNFGLRVTEVAEPVRRLESIRCLW
jgi:flagellar motor switch protein FliN